MSGERTSPARATRVQEKEELAELNDRFLQYIEQVRSMKEANLRLELELCSTKEQLGSEADSVKALYEAELADARNLIDETAKEKARQQILASKNATRIEELEAELKEAKDALSHMEARCNTAERNANSLDAQRKSALADKNKFQKQAKDLEAELAELRENYDAIKSSLESETLSKVDLQNHIQSLHEEMAFKKKVYEEELASLRAKLSGTFSGILETDYQAQFDSRLEIAIDELREKSEADIADYKLQVEAAYKDKIAALDNQCVRHAETITKLTMELKKVTSSRSDQDNDITKLQRKIEKLEATVREQRDELDRTRRRHSDEISQRLEELRQLRENYELKIREYEELMDIKVQLDQEIATYRALLTGEETRLNLTPTPREKRTRSHTQTTTDSVSKKARLETSLSQTNQTTTNSSAAGHIHIIDVDADGRYVEIQNVSEEVESIGGIKIQHEVEGGPEVVFRFHNKSKLQGGGSVKVWSGDADGALHNPPSDLTWRSQSWGSGKKTTTRLIKGGEEIAKFERSIERSPCKQREEVDVGTGSLDSSTRSFPRLPDDSEPRSKSTKRVTKRYTVTQQQTGGEHVFHQRGDPEPGEKNCVVS